MLVDTSVWIEVFRGHDHPLFHALTSSHEVVTCLPVLQEVLQGFDAEPSFRFARSAFARIPAIETTVTRQLVDDAVHLYRTARRNGFTIRSSVDCLIAACAIRNEVAVLHKDRDFDSLARISELKTIRFELPS